MDAIIDELKNFPDLKIRLFETAVNKFMNNVSNDALDKLTNILDDSVQEKELRFKAYFCLTFYYRRTLNTLLTRQLIEKYQYEFTDIPMNNMVLSVYFAEFQDTRNLKKALNYSKALLNNTEYSNHVGVIHNYCYIVSNIIENQIDGGNDELQPALEKIEDLLELDSTYARFHHTRAKLLIENEQFTEAMKSILKAIELEDETNKDYAIRINYYRNSLLEIKSRKLYRQMKEDISNAENRVLEQTNLIEVKVKNSEDEAKKVLKEMDSMRNTNLQMLTFFTAIISFIIGSVNIISKQESFFSASLLMLVFAGTLLLINLAAAIIFTDIKLKNFRFIITLLLGIVLIASGVCIYIFMK